MPKKFFKHTAYNKRIIAIVATVALLGMQPSAAIASSWSPTLLVNTESFQIIDEGDSTTDIEIRFGDTVNEIFEWDRTNAEFHLTDDLDVDGNITSSGTLTVSGNAKTKGDLTINSDSGAADAVLTFGSDSTNETLTFINTEDTLEWSDDFQVTGGLAASGKLVIDGAAEFNSTVKINGVTYTFPYTDGTATGKVLKTDGAGNLVWSDDNNSGGFSFTELNSWFVNRAGDTMTGALTVHGTVSGSTLSGGYIVGERGHVSTSLTSSGTLSVDGAAGFEGNVTVGNANSDSVTFNADVTSNFIPNDETYDLGSTSQRWNNIYANTGDFDADLTLNQDDGAVDVTLTFGSDGTSETLTWINTEDVFEFSDDIQTTGALSASGKLVIDGAAEFNSTVKINGVTYTFPYSDGTATGKVLKTDGAGNLVWSDDTAGRSSGSIMSFHPEYPNAVYFASGSSAVGTLGLRYASSGSGLGNFYRWQTTKTTNQDYWISTRVRIPDNFSTWQETKPIELRYRTHSGTINVYAKDTDDANIALTGGSDLDTNDWTTATITGPESSGTWATGGYATFLIQLINSGATYTNRTWADVSWVNLNVETSD